MSLWQRLKKSAETFTEGLKSAVGLGAKLDAAAREALEEALLQADVGAAATQEILDALAKKAGGAEVDLKAELAALIQARLEPLEKPLAFTHNPAVVLVLGVNGSGKTTSIGKLAAQLARGGTRVVVAAGDTFRAGAVEQLAVWAERAGKKGSVDIVRPAKEGADAAGVAYAALEQAKASGAEVVLVDTAGRLGNRADLMAELPKMVRVLQKLDASAPHNVILVLDGTLGQATLQQVKDFNAAVPLTGLVVSKLDSSAKAGVLLALAAHKLPVHYVGLGEGLDDLAPFSAAGFARGLVGLE